MSQNPTEDVEQPESPLTAVESWDLVADFYTANLVSWAEFFAREALHLACLPPIARIVDVATGPGTLALLAARQGATVSAIDLSPAMVANLKRRAGELGLSIADVRVGDGQSLPYEDDTFDGAFSMLGLIFFPDRAVGFRELHRVLRTGGKAVVSSIASIEGGFDLVMEALRKSVPEALPSGDSTMPLASSDEFTSEMSSAGFDEVTIYTLVQRVSTPSAAEFWYKTQRSAVTVANVRHKVGEARWPAIDKAILKDLEAMTGGGRVEETYTINLGVGIK